VSRNAVLALAALLPIAAAACGDAKAYPYLKPDAGGGGGGSGGTGGVGGGGGGGFTGSCPTEMVGYAAVARSSADGGTAEPTTGGGNVAPTPVNDVQGLTAALQSPDPAVILLDGMLQVTTAIKVTQDKDARNGNKTLIGVGTDSGLTGAGLDLSYADNVILRNLKISKAAAGEGDAVTLLASHHIWVDHCDLSSERTDASVSYDGLVDVTHGSEFVTVSWTVFHDHKDTSLVGHTATATAQAEDQNLTVTYHHNLFLNVNSGPRIRWGRAHLFSNHFQDVTIFGAVSTSDATVLVEHNVFDNVGLPLATTYQDPTAGFMTETENDFSPAFTPDLAAPPVVPIVLPYSYSPDSSVSSIVAYCAGTGRITLP
jgi:pectate lyase